jgi:hypothetical protein
MRPLPPRRSAERVERGLREHRVNLVEQGRLAAHDSHAPPATPRTAVGPWNSLVRIQPPERRSQGLSTWQLGVKDGDMRCVDLTACAWRNAETFGRARLVELARDASCRPRHAHKR